MNTGSTNASTRLRLSRRIWMNSLRVIAIIRRWLNATSLLHCPARGLDAGDEHVLERRIDRLDRREPHVLLAQPRLERRRRARRPVQRDVHGAPEQTGSAHERRTGERLD